MCGKLRVAICEDLPEDTAALQEIVLSCGVPCVIKTFDNGEDFLMGNPANQFDLVFLDVYMDAVNGLEIAKRLRQEDAAVQIVFITSSEDHALEAFRVKARQYLIKPVQAEEVQAVMDELRQRLVIAAPTVSLPVGGSKRQIAPKDILYAEVYGYQSYVHLAEEIVEVKMSLDDLASLLPDPDFLRCHRSYVVNLNYVKEIGRDFIMKNGATVYIRRGDVKKCGDAYKEYLLERAGRDDL